MSDFLNARHGSVAPKICGSIMRELAKSLFNPLTAAALSFALKSDLAGGLYYLERIGYISTERVAALGYGANGALIRMTAKGVDAIEGTIPLDVGVAL